MRTPKYQSVKSLRMSEQVSGIPRDKQSFHHERKDLKGLTSQIFEESSTYTDTHFLVM